MDHNSHLFGQNGIIEISLVSTVYNEEQSIDKLLTALDVVFKKSNLSYELVIVDDGSTDNSLQVLKGFIGLIPNLRVVEIYKNKGQSAALSAALSVARGKWVIMMDGDLQHDPEFVPQFIALSEQNHDLISSYRERRQEKFIRKVITAISNRINRYLIGVDIKDFGSSFRMIHSDILKAITDSNGYVYYNTAALYKNARNVIEIPIVQHRRPYGLSKWSLLDFIMFNLDLITTSSRLTQIILFISGLGGITGILLYAMHILGIFPEATSISAPASITLISFTLAVLAVVWREVVEIQKMSKGIAPYLIHAIWSDGVAECDSPLADPKKQRD